MKVFAHFLPIDLITGNSGIYCVVCKFLYFVTVFCKYFNREK